jgi:hypothetical protein
LAVLLVGYKLRIEWAEYVNSLPAQQVPALWTFLLDFESRLLLAMAVTALVLLVPTRKAGIRRRDLGTVQLCHYFKVTVHPSFLVA